MLDIYARDRYETRGCPEEWDPAIEAAEAGNLTELAAALEPTDVYSKEYLVLRQEDLWALRTLLAARGMVLVDEGPFWVVGRDDDEETLAAEVGAVPEVEIDNDTTAEQCGFCLNLAAGPPGPFCCARRERWVLQLASDIKPNG